jgi:hypothetical protein
LCRDGGFRRQTTADFAVADNLSIPSNLPCLCSYPIIWLLCQAQTTGRERKYGDAGQIFEVFFLIFKKKNKKKKLSPGLTIYFFPFKMNASRTNTP